MLEIVVAMCSEPGRRKTNEDSVHVTRDGLFVLAALADGAGGHRNGATASQIAVQRVDAQIHDAPAFEPGIFHQAMIETHRAVQRAQSQTDALYRMHTTLVALWLDGENGRALWSNVGDSRLYLLRDGQVSQLSVDDSLIQQMLEAGLLLEGPARVHPQRGPLLAALGVEGDVEPHTSKECVATRSGDAFLLCSDGWWSALSEDEIASTQRAATSPVSWLAAMQVEIEAKDVQRQDNFSAIAAWVMDTDDVTQPMPAPYFD